MPLDEIVALAGSFPLVKMLGFLAADTETDPEETERRLLAQVAAAETAVG